MIKLSDYVVSILAKKGIDTYFTVSGGGIMHLLDSVGTHKGVKYFCNYHEQACAIAAEGHARIKGKPCGCLVTLGPGAVNAIAGMVGAWFDSVPMIVLTGQVRRDLIADYSKIRQYGPQEGDVVSMAKPITKYATTVTDPNSIRYEVEKAFHLSISGRPGPVLLAIPLDVQGAEIDETKLVGFEASETSEQLRGLALRQAAEATIEMLSRSKRPILVGGTGVRTGGAHELFLKTAETFGIPVVLPYTAKDLIPEDHPLNFGIFGTAGQRRANFVVQNSDLLLSCATGFSLSKVGFNFKGFAPRAKKILVEIDHGQLYNQVLKADLPIEADICDYLKALLAAAAGRTFIFSSKWLPACRDWRKQYPIIVGEFKTDKTHVNSYIFVDSLADHLCETDVVISGNGIDTVSTYQAFKIKAGQRSMTSNNWGSMGWDLPLSIGACIANDFKRVICVTGDGSIQWNIQELLFLQFHKLPVKIFVFNNQGYWSIRATQSNFFAGRLVGADSSSGVANPNFEKLAAAYDIPFFRIPNNSALSSILPQVLAIPGPVICELNIAVDQGVSPKASAFKREDGVLESRPLEDMSPFLPREEVYANMHKFDDDL
jgi:acetolactate synthase I/II/III large subunit